jgi:hypothetical protein
VAAGIIAVIAIAGFVSYSRMNERLDDAAARAASAERGVVQSRAAARDQIASVERAADRRIATAQQTAQNAQRLAGILTARDLRRFDLAGRGLARGAAGQLLWSRAEGLALTMSGLQPAPGREYQLWLVAANAPVSAGLLSPDASGRAVLVAATPAGLPRPVTDIWVTAEPQGGSARPSGRSLAVVTVQPGRTPVP